WLQPCLLKIYSHMVTFWGNYEGISQCKALSGTIISHLSQMEKSLPDPLPDPIQRKKKKG
ncbi:hypothetical protein ABN243_07770, partial [Escherichia coli]